MKLFPTRLMTKSQRKYTFLSDFITSRAASNGWDSELAGVAAQVMALQPKPNMRLSSSAGPSQIQTKLHSFRSKEHNSWST